VKESLEIVLSCCGSALQKLVLAKAVRDVKPRMKLVNSSKEENDQKRMETGRYKGTWCCRQKIKELHERLASF